MQNFNEFISNITDYNNNTYSGKYRPLLNAEDAEYVGEDLVDNITKNYDTINPTVVAALELVYSSNRSNILLNNTYGDYYKQFDLENRSKKAVMDKLNKDVTQLMKG